MSIDRLTKEITAKLETGVKELFESDKYLDYLKTMSRFHQYSTRNTLLIHLQMPGATQVAGYNSWKNKFERQVKKGEKGIKIFAPVAFKVSEEKEKLDPETHQPVLDENGMPVTEQSEKTFARFKVTSVFDVSQTDGKPLPMLAENIMGDVSHYELFMDALREVSPLPIVFEKLEDCDGVCRFGENIAIKEGMSEIQTVCAAIHEITHAKLHDRQMLADNDEKPKSRRTEEVEAESVSYAVCQYYGIETNINSFGYIAEWSKTHELRELNTSLDTIRKSVAELIDGIDERYQALAKERGIDLTAQSAESPSVQTELEIAAETSRLPLLDEYAHAKNDWLIGSNVLLMPVFDDLNFNRTGKKIRVKVEEPAGKYQLFSQDRNGEESLYFMTASGRITRTAEYFNSDWDEIQHKHINHRPTEAELDEIIPKIEEAFEKSLAEPTKWALYQYAAVVNRIDECDAHNIPVRKLRDEERVQRHEAAEKQRQAEQQQKQEKYDNRIGEVAAAIGAGETINVVYDEYAFDGKNPVLDLFKMYGIALPLRTQGWVNTGLAEITEDSYRYYKSKHKGDSTTFGRYLKQLRQAIRERPIEQKSGGNKEVENAMEHNIYKKFAELFPQMANKEYSYMRLEAQGFEPLSLEWIFGDRISIMQTYTMNGDLMYDPMIEFSVNSEAKTMTAVSFEQSMPPLYQRVDENGDGQSIDGNGKEWESPNLQKEINDFTAQWFQNIGEQNHIPVKATLWNEGGIDDVDVRITFDKDGNPIMPEAEPSVDEVKDKFNVDERWETVTWIYFNPNSNAGGQYVTNQLDFEFVRDAAAQTDNADNFFDYIGSECKQYLTDIDTPEFAAADRDFKNNSYTFSGCTDETMNALIKMATAKERSEVSITAEPPKASCVLPDPTVSIFEMNDYGYTSDDMYPLTEAMALELFDSDYTIYMLYDDNTDALVMDRDEIITFCGDGYCGITHEDWQSYLDSHTVQHSEGSLESDLLYGNEDKFGIYQVKGGDDFRDYRFESSEELYKRGLEIDRKNYNLIYTAPLAADVAPENIFVQFNINRPEDFTGHSLSMGDVIVFQREGDIQSYYLDRGGYLELPSFTGDERTAEQRANDATLSQVGTRSQPTVAELEADVKAGKTISLTDLANATHTERKESTPKGKPSIMERLEANKERVAAGGGQHLQKNNELEV